MAAMIVTMRDMAPLDSCHLDVGKSLLALGCIGVGCATLRPRCRAFPCPCDILHTPVRPPLRPRCHHRFVKELVEATLKRDSNSDARQ
jgi:hypothetical protein